MRPEEYAIINQDWRYIRYADGGEELYDVRADPNEWDNLAGKPKYDEVKQRLNSAAPRAFAPPGPATDDLKLEVEGQNFRWTAQQK